MLSSSANKIAINHFKRSNFIPDGTTHIAQELAGILAGKILHQTDYCFAII
jgi:hypothetical protein